MLRQRQQPQVRSGRRPASPAPVKRCNGEPGGSLADVDVFWETVVMGENYGYACTHFHNIVPAGLKLPATMGDTFQGVAPEASDRALIRHWVKAAIDRASSRLPGMSHTRTSTVPKL